MGNTIKKMFTPRDPEINSNRLPAEQQEKNNRFFTPPQPRQIHHTMPQISNLKNIKPITKGSFIGLYNKGKPIVQLTKHIINKNTENINKNNKKCPIHSKFVFHFIRHAESCSNQRQTINNSLRKKMNSGSDIEPFISDKGILDCNYSKQIYTEYLTNKISNYFCSCLQRTWDTAYVLFGKDNIEKFMVGPYLKEDRTSPSNLPVLYNENVWRFNFFKEYADKLISNPNNSASSANSPQQSSANSPQQSSANQSQPNLVNPQQQSSANQSQPNSANSSQKNRQNSKNCPRYSGDGSALYPPIYYESDLDKFILWYLENFKLLNKCNNHNNSNKEIHVVVVCHSHIIQKFVDKRMSFDEFNKQLKTKPIVGITEYKDYFKKYFNYCISVNVEYNTSQNTKKDIINKYNKDYNKSLDLLQDSEHSNNLTKGNKLKESENTMKDMVPVCGFGNICVTKISIGYIGSNGTSHESKDLSPICRYSKNQNFLSTKILSNIK